MQTSIVVLRYTFQQLLKGAFTLLGITFLVFLIMSQLPGGAVLALAVGPQASPEVRAALRAALGSDDPVYSQYLRWLLGGDWMRRDTDADGIADWSIIIPLDANGDGQPEPPGQAGGILRGDFGTSLRFRRPPSARSE